MLSEESAQLLLYMISACLAIPGVFGWLILIPLHFRLAKKLDTSLFNEKYFRPTDLAIYSNFPFYFFRGLLYAFGAVIPWWTRKYFDYYPIRKHLSSLEYFFCVLFVGVVFIGMLGMLLLGVGYFLDAY